MPDSLAQRPPWRLIIALVAAAVILAGLGLAVQFNRLPARFNMADMGYADFGGGRQPAGTGHGQHGHGHGGTDGDGVTAGIGIDTLVGDTAGRTPDVRMSLTARAERITISDGPTLDGFTLNGSTPGPTIQAVEGDLVEVVVTNENVADGITLHWHGVDVPNAMDGVAGVTQDAVAPGASHTYRFVADQVGTYWYHSHQQSHPQVLGGLLGALVVRPAAGPGDVTDVTALVHAYGGVRTINGRPGDTRVDAEPGRTVRVRIINTDNTHMPVWVAGGAYRVLAVDGSDISGPTPVADRALLVAAGGRADLEVTAPADGTGVRVQMANASVVVGRGDAPAVVAPAAYVDLLSYGTPTGPAIDPAQADRTFDYVIGRGPGLLDGRPGLWWTINGHIFPDVPMFMVDEGDLVVMRLSNTSGEPHPMHLHGHHVRVLSRDGVPSTGSPWSTDSLNVEDRSTYVIAFVADNPGIWMDHCHNLPHASEGLMTHLAYIGYTTPFLVGGDHRNHPE